MTRAASAISAILARRNTALSLCALTLAAFVMERPHWRVFGERPRASVKPGTYRVVLQSPEGTCLSGFDLAHDGRGWVGLSRQRPRAAKGERGLRKGFAI